MGFSIYDILAGKRDGGKHSPEEIRFLVNGFVCGNITDYQMSAWLMAVCINGLDREETVALTEAMVDSGETIDLSSLPGITVDKHSTGGVGDKTTLVLAPLLASAGLTVAKMSGRGLGITGGTIDKLESIPGFKTSLAKEQFFEQAEKIGCVVAGQTANLVPADKKMYALRDVTGTVESIPLIASSVMSKKIASGAGVILLDVKVGSGAFMKDIESARKLAGTMVEIGQGMGRKTVAAITGMDQPLGMAVGNSVEVAEAIETLKGGGPTDLKELCIELAALLSMAAGQDDSTESARARMTGLLASGAALDRFRAMVDAQGGDIGVVDDPKMLPQARFSRSIIISTSGYVQSLDAEAIGRAVGLLGAGRQKKDDVIDPAAGIILSVKTADPVNKNEEVARLLFSRNVDIDQAAALVKSAFRMGPDPVQPAPLIREIIRF